MTTSLNLAGWAALVGISAAVFHAILIAPGHIASKPRQWIEALVNWIGARSNYGLPYDIAKWLTTSAVDCSWCFAGQLGLFHYVYTGGRDPFEAFIYLCASILACKVAFQYLTNGKK